ncbi:MAG: aminoglycoside phosphotransferase family protein [Gemmatimonadota bacterium]
MPERSAWLKRLPHVVRGLQARWTLSLGATFDGSEMSCAWVAPAVRENGTRAVLKLGMPHMETAHEIQALCLWDGDPTVRLLESDADLNAMLLERCEPGTALRERPELEQESLSQGCSVDSGADQRHRRNAPDAMIRRFC